MNSLKVYHGYLVETGQWTEQPISLRYDRVQIAAGSEHVVEALTDEEVECVLKEIKKETYSERDRLIVMVLLYTAVRVSELIQMKWSDIDTLTQTFVVRGKVREIGLRQGVLYQLTRYRATERATSHFADSPYVRSCLWRKENSSYANLMITNIIGNFFLC